MAIGYNNLGCYWNRESIRTNAPSASGVYAIYNTVYLYIGETDNLQRRLLEHFNGDNRSITHARPSGFAYELCDPIQRMMRQAYLVRQFQPPCNQQLR